MIQFLKKAQKKDATNLETKAQEGKNKNNPQAQQQDDEKKAQQDKVRADQKKQDEKEAKTRKEEILREQEAVRKADRLKKDEEYFQARQTAEEQNKKTEHTQKVKKEEEDKKLKQTRATEEANRLKAEKEKKEVELASKRVATLNAQEKLARAKDVVSGLRTLAQKGLHNMSAADKEQFVRLAIEYKALSAGGAVQINASSDVERLLQEVTGADRSEVNYFLTEDQKKRSKKEDEEASKSAKMKWFLTEFQKNPSIIYENVELFEQAAKDGKITADTIVTDDNGQQVTIKDYTREQLDQACGKAISIAKQYKTSTDEYRKVVACTAVKLCELNPEDVQESLAILEQYDPAFATMVGEVYEGLTKNPEARAFAMDFIREYGLGSWELSDLANQGAEVRAERKILRRQANEERENIDTQAGVAGVFNDRKVIKVKVDEVDTAFRVFKADALDYEEDTSDYGSMRETPSPTRADPVRTPSTPARMPIEAVERNMHPGYKDVGQDGSKNQAIAPECVNPDDVNRIYDYVYNPSSSVSGMNALAAATNGPALGTGLGTRVPVDDGDYPFPTNNKANC